MIYKSYTELIRDIEYKDELSKRDIFDIEFEEYNINRKTVKEVKREWMNHIKEKYELTKKSNSQLGKFLKKYPLKLKELCVLLELIEENDEMSYFEIRNSIMESKDIFKKYKVRYESSQLRKFKLVYKIVHPLRPMRSIYEVSYKAQLELNNKKYTSEYEQLDMALEEESKRNSPDELDNLYYIVKPKVSFNDLVVSEELKEKLRFALSREAKKEKIFKEWGFEKIIQYGRGTTLNFRGPPGTGKTLAAHCLAHELKRKLLIVRYDQLVDAFVGVTEKHIQRTFKIAKTKNAVLLFDEADAIALDRKNLQRSWEMSQVNTLLKELERFEGICIFTTNLYDKYDPAFERRLTMHIDFNLPEKNQRLKILMKLLPKKARDKNLSLKNLNLDGLSGGDIKNLVLNAAGIAAKEDSEKIKRSHIEKSIQMLKSGKLKQNKVKYIG